MERTLTVHLGDRALDLVVQRWARDHEGVIHRRRLEHLGEQAATCRGVAVQHSSSGCFGDRMRLHLDDGRVVRLHLYWPRHQPVAAILGVRWTEWAGWMVTARTTAGDRLPIYAWRAQVLLPGRGHSDDHATWPLLG